MACMQSEKKSIKKGNVEFNSDIFLRIKKSFCGVVDKYIYCQLIQGIIKAGGLGKMGLGIPSPVRRLGRRQEGVSFCSIVSQLQLVVE